MITEEEINKAIGREPTYTKEESKKVFEALRRAYFLIEKNDIKDEYFEQLRFGLEGLLPSQIVDMTLLRRAIAENIYLRPLSSGNIRK